MSWMAPDRALPVGEAEPLALEHARNDIHPVNRWQLLPALPAYFRLRWFGGVRRAPYVPAAWLGAS